MKFKVLGSKPDYLSDLIVHEATYLEGEKEKAHQYFHHISNRYDDVRHVPDTRPPLAAFSWRTDLRHTG